MLQDIKKRNEELFYAKEKAEKSERLKSSFLTNLSHEIRTPLTAINGLSFLLIAKEFSEDKKFEYYQLIQENTNDLLATFDDIIEYSKIETNQVFIEKKPITVYDFFSALYLSFQDHAIRKKKPNIEFRCNFPDRDRDKTIISDQRKLRVILEKIIHNAFKFTDQGFVEIGYVYSDTNIQFYIKDTGIGISKENFGSIFERFIKIQNKKMLFRGNGLGLTIAKGYADYLGANVSLESELGIGSTFFVDICV